MAWRIVPRRLVPALALLSPLPVHGIPPIVQ